ncbi:MAG: SET domain-containing protein-lysine N-methyltransferase [Legionellaceae bacterium]|nr:SET domain-containing protein-lysine N-methyltransferase [Legionellaceae bacterium]
MIKDGYYVTQILLTNKKVNAAHQQVTIDVVTGICTFEDDQEIPLKHFMRQSDFHHPLMIEPYSPVVDQVYHYEYDDIDGLLYTAIYVYSRLLHADRPQDCQFKINPSTAFKAQPFADKIYISMNSHQEAQDVIQMKQFETIVSLFRGYPFEFSEDTIIYDTFLTKDLPASINGDKLYETNEDIIRLLKEPIDFSYGELRYIDPSMGFGVYCREPMKEGDVVAIYNGVKTVHEPNFLEYTYSYKLDIMQLYTDSRYCGNMSRFVNHAPDKDDPQKKLRRRNFLPANVKSETHYVNGIGVIVYSARRDIRKGEQLLVSYGKRYFENVEVGLFKPSGERLGIKKRFFQREASRRIGQIRIMAHNGVRKAHVFLLKRMLCITSVTLILAGIVNYSA